MKHLLIALSFMMFLSISCKKTSDESKAKGTVTFGANYHMINQPTKVTIFIDNKKAGELTSYASEVIICGASGNVTKELTAGTHSYKVEIRSSNGGSYFADTSGTFNITEGQCTKMFIDYEKIFLM